MNFRGFPEARDKVLDDLTGHMNNFRQWLDETDIDLTDAECEILFQLDLDEGFYMRRKIDLLTSGPIIDFKSGRWSGRLSRDTLFEMVYSVEAVARAGEGWRDAVVVYVGGAKPYEIWPFQNPKTPYKPSKQKAMQHLDRNIQVRRMIGQGRVPGIDPYAKFCKFCSYRQHCRGEPSGL